MICWLLKRFKKYIYRITIEADTNHVGFFRLFFVILVKLYYMKRIYYLLLLLPFLSLAQVSTGQEQQFDYGLQNLAPQTVTTPSHLCTQGIDGTIGIIPYAYIAKDADVLHTTGNESFTGTKSSIVDDSSAISLTNIGATQAIYVSNASSSSGIGVYTDNTGTSSGMFSNNTHIGDGIVSNGSPTATGYNYVGKNNGVNTFTVDKFGNLLANSINTTGGFAMADTGVKTFAGLATNSSTSINIGAVTGQVVDNETDPANPVSTNVNYAGATNVTVTTLGSGQSSFVMLDSAGVISFQNTFPTSAERKAKIWLGKVSHPSGTITLVVNEPDYIISPMAFSRDLFQAMGPYINDGVYAYANGSNLNINITAGNIHGDGINFVNSRTSPNEVAMGPGVAQAFFYRTQTGGVTSAVTAITPDFYDNAGTVTAIAGSSNQATIQYIEAIPGQGYIIQYGQTIYSTITEAVAALGKESRVRWSNLVENAIPIGAIVTTKGCAALNNTSTALFFNASKLGDFFGASAGYSTASLQTTYNNSLVPQITTSTALGAMTIKRGSAADTDNILVGQNGAGTNTSTIDGNGKATLGNVYSNGGVSATSANARGNYFTNALTATANNDNLTCLHLSPTFTAGAFTNVNQSVLRATWNASNFSISDGFVAGNVLLYSVALPSANNYFFAASTSTTYLNAPLTSGGIEIRLGNSKRAQFSPTTGNFTLSSAAITDAGYRLDVFDNTRLNGSLTLSTAPTTSAGSYDVITRNSSTGVIEKASSLVLITITTAVSITTATTDSNSVGQNGRHVVIDNGVNAINLTCNGGVTTSYGKIGSGAITFVQGSGRTLVQLSGTAVFNGAVGSTATLWSSGTTDYLAITNY